MLITITINEKAATLNGGDGLFLFLTALFPGKDSDNDFLHDSSARRKRVS